MKCASEKNSTTGQGHYTKYALAEVMRCARCGSKFRRLTWSRKGCKKIVWRCYNRVDNGPKFCSDSPTILETDLHAAIVRAMGAFNGDDYELFQATMIGSISEAIGLHDDGDEAELLNRRINMLNQEMLALVDMSIKSELSIEDNEQRFQVIAEEIEQLTARLNALRESGKSDTRRKQEAEALQAAIAQMSPCTGVYNDNAVRQMIECIKVYPDGKLDIIFNGGYTIVEHINLK